ncbi:hypothetical protein F5Y07DRAFT_400329 [Xylaria sp. FL0933]|nr:hypothetical protein F5Y07DRAFT_400329 [Xylaria sp. FL0933]
MSPSEHSSRSSVGGNSGNSGGSGGSGGSGSSSGSKQRTTMIPGRLINPKRLENMLKERFGEEYNVEMRNDCYTIKAKDTIQYSDIRKCY